MKKLLIDIDNHVLDIEVMAERAKVLVDDVGDSFFGWDITAPDQTWRVRPEYYRIANVKMDIANGILFDLMQEIKALQEPLNTEPETTPITQITDTLSQVDSSTKFGDTITCAHQDSPARESRCHI
mgnify:CR=1 FL=1